MGCEPLLVLVETSKTVCVWGGGEYGRAGLCWAGLVCAGGARARALAPVEEHQSPCVCAVLARTIKTDLMAPQIWQGRAKLRRRTRQGVRNADASAESSSVQRRAGSGLGSTNRLYLRYIICPLPPRPAPAPAPQLLMAGPMAHSAMMAALVLGAGEEREAESLLPLLPTLMQSQGQVGQFFFFFFFVTPPHRDT